MPSLTTLMAMIQALPWEPIAVLLAIGYLVLAVRENLLCWWCALGSSAIYTVLLWNAHLFMESGLNVYYMIMAGYGWHQWRRGGPGNRSLAISTLRPRTHLAIGVLIVVSSLLSGSLLARHTSAAWPYLDSFTTWASVITTWLVARKVLENWLYWLVIDTVSIALYFDRGLYQTAALFVGYLVLATIGYLDWRRTYRDGDGSVAAVA